MKVTLKTVKNNVIVVDIATKIISSSALGEFGYSLIKKVAMDGRATVCLESTKGLIALSTESGNALNDAIKAIKAAELEAAVPGVTELRAARIALNAFNAALLNLANSESAVKMPPRPTVSVANLEEKYPEAARYLDAEIAKLMLS